MKHIMRLYTFIFCSFLLISCQSNTDVNKACHDWLNTSIQKQESVPPNKRFSVSLDQIVQSCQGAMPTSLKQSIQQGKNYSWDKQLALLQQSVKTYFPSVCSDTNPSAPVKSLQHICLGDDFPDGRYTSILENIDAASYMFGKAVEQELLKISVDKNQVKRFMLNYFLGAAEQKLQ